MRDVDLAVFDLAGTTVEDRGQVPEAFAAALAGHGLTATPGQISAARGASKRQAILGLIPEGPDQATQAAEVYATFQDRLAGLFAAGGVRSIPGTEPVFTWLRERGARIALNTGFDRELTTLLLDALHWDSRAFDAVVCGDDVRQGRPAPFMIFRAMELAGVVAVQRVAVVGDTILDLQAGANAGVKWNIGVLTGAHDRATLETAPHTHLIGSVAELPDCLGTI